MEQWKDIPGYEGRYQASTEGRIKSLAHTYEWYGTYRSVDDRAIGGLALSTKGYLRVNLSGVVCMVHRLVALAWIPNPENKPQINHIDGDKKNNKVSNLEWVTNQENRDHAVQNGLHKGPPRKLTDSQRDEIKKLARAGENQQKLARRFGVCQQVISKIKLMA